MSQGIPNEGELVGKEVVEPKSEEALYGQHMRHGGHQCLQQNTHGTSSPWHTSKFLGEGRCWYDNHCEESGPRMRRDGCGEADGTAARAHTQLRVEAASAIAIGGARALLLLRHVACDAMGAEVERCGRNGGADTS